jgi:hypothetical protein
MITGINLNASKMNCEERRDKLEEVAFQLHQIVNSTIFRDKVLRMRPWGETSEWKSASGAMIYNHIMSGAEETNGIEDRVMDIYVDDFFSYRNIVGYMNPFKKWIHVNTKYFDKRFNKAIGSNILHEYGHTLGFRHEGGATKARPHSICYRLNVIYEECHNKLVGNNIPSLVKIKVGRTWYGKSIYKWDRRCRVSTQVVK